VAWGRGRVILRARVRAMFKVRVKARSKGQGKPFQYYYDDYDYDHSVKIHARDLQNLSFVYEWDILIFEVINVE
jgi:hypothetical protein